MSKKKTLLIVDDEEDLRDTVSYKFKAEGFNIETAVDGLDALEKLKDVSPDLIILDMNMPRMNGLEFYEKIKGEDEKPKYPVLVLTARANMEQLFLDLDVDGFMAKPFDLNELFEEGKKVIKKYSGSVRKEAGSDEIRARRVCLVENDPKVCDAFSLAFLEAGYIVNTAHSGAAAIKRITRDVPDVVAISLSLNDIAGDVVIGKLKRLEQAKNVKYVLYTKRSGDKAQVTEKIAQKDGIDQYIEFSSADDILEGADELFS